MKNNNFIIKRFEFVKLTLQNIGPFQEKPTVLDFTDSNGDPCNFYLLMSKNGCGKTTILDVITSLMNMLNDKQITQFGHEDLDKNQGKAQLDIILKLCWGERDETIILSLLVLPKEEDFLTHWNEISLAEIGASSWHKLGYKKNITGEMERIGKDDFFVNIFLARIFFNPKLQSTEFENNQLTLPTLMYFSSYRNIPKITDPRRGIMEPEMWRYKPVYKFAMEGEDWLNSLDNLMVWLKWLDDGRFEQAVKIINERVFKGQQKFLKNIRKVPPQAVINNQGQEHSLDRLSSGEKSLVQLFLRIGAHKTRNTILLIDEIDIHLHTKLKHRLLNLLKAMIKEQPGLTVIAATHSRQLLTAFAFEIQEQGLRKGGHLIED